MAIIEKTASPYDNLDTKAFWRPAVADRSFHDVKDISTPLIFTKADKIATAGSCFAQHIGRHLRDRGATYMDLEPAPPIFVKAGDAQKFGFGIYSCRYGNIYTTRQLFQLVQEAMGQRKVKNPVWEKAGRYYDALRPGIDPVGQDSAQDVIGNRVQHLNAVLEMFRTLDVFVFTLGLTEGWVDSSDSTVFPSAPGTICGTYTQDRFSFINLSYNDILADLISFADILRGINTSARILLTVSPVPLTATASGEHVLVASTYSKSVLRAVAGFLDQTDERFSYFPSYELISSHPSRGMFFNPDMRTVNDAGVHLVMDHFFRDLADFKSAGELVSSEQNIELICEEKHLDPLSQMKVRD
jgi:hypothetical protein